jgi:hypothetical protein
LKPFSLSSCDELIDDALRVIGEITELSFPDVQTVRRYERIAEFETECTVFRQGRIANDEAGLAGSEIIEGNILMFIDLVVDDSVSLGERATLNVLSRDADVDMF